MKHKVLCALFFFLFVYNMAAFAIQDRYVKHVATWEGYPHTSAFDVDDEHDIIFIGVGNEVRIHDANNLRDTITVINTITFEANVKDLLYSDGFLFISNDDFGIFVYDVTDSEPVKVYNDPKCQRATALAANDMFVLVVTESSNSNLSIYDIENPGDIQIVSRLQLPDLHNIQSIVLYEQFVFVVDNDEGINVFNLEELIKGEINHKGQYDNHSDLKHLFIQDEIAYISDRESCFSIINFSNPEMQDVYACVDEIESSIGSVIVEQYAYVATYDTKSVWVLNVEDPYTVILIEEYDLDYEAFRIHAGNDHIFVSSVNQLHIYQLTQGFPEPDFSATPTSGDAPLDVIFHNGSSGDILSYKWDFGDGYTSTVSDPDHTYAFAGQYTVTLAVSNGQRWYTEMKANYISVHQTLPKANFEMDIQSRVCPLVVKFIQKSSGNYTSVHWDFDDGYTSTEKNPVHTFTTNGRYDVTLTIFAMNDSYKYSQPVNVRNSVIPIAQWNSKSIYTFCSDPQKKYGFAGSADGINVLDISNPFSITLVDHFPLLNQPENFFYTQNLLLAACGESGVNIFDISTPEDITIVSHIPINSRHIWLEHPNAYISTELGVSIYDLTSLSEPDYVTTIKTIGEAYALKKFDQYAFIVDNGKGLACYKQKHDLDFFRPNYFEAENLVQFDYDQAYLFTAVKETGVFIVEYGDTGDQLQRYSSIEHLNALDICVRNDYAFIACDQEGLAVYNVRDKKIPTPIKNFYTTGNAYDVVDVYPYLFVAEGEAGLKIFVQPEQNELQMQTPRILLPGNLYEGEVCLPFYQLEPVTIDIQPNHHVSMIDESVSLTQGQLCQKFSFIVDLISDDINIMDPQVHFKATTKGWFDANSFSFITNNSTINTYTANDLPLNIPDEESGTSIINIADQGIIKCLSVQLRIQTKELEDLKVTLTSPQNVSMILFESVNPGEYLDTIELNLDDRATVNISDARIPLLGFYQPQDSFSNVNGHCIHGEWKLLIEDKAQFNSTILTSWSMFFELSAVNASPFIENQQPHHMMTSTHPKTDFPTNQFSSLKPVIQLIDVPPIGNRIRPITGVIHNVVNFSGYLTIYILTDSWYLKPRWETPITSFNHNGHWQCDITTKWGDEKATKIAVFLFSRDRQPLLMPDFPVLPQYYFHKAVDHKIFDRQKK